LPILAPIWILSRGPVDKMTQVVVFSYKQLFFGFLGLFWYTIWHMFKKFLIKQLVKKQLKNLPKEQQEMIIELVSNNPELFKKIGDEIQAKIKGGMDQQYATVEVMKKYQGELQKISPQAQQKFQQK